MALGIEFADRCAERPIAADALAAMMPGLRRLAADQRRAVAAAYLPAHPMLRPKPAAKLPGQRL